MDKILLTVSTSLYFLISLSIIHLIFGYKITRKLYILVEICLICVLLSLTFVLTENEISLLCALFHFIQIILTYFSIHKSRLITIVALYGLVYSFNSILVGAVNCFISLSIETLTVVDFIIHIAVTLLVITFCFCHKTRHKIQRIFWNIPRKIKALTVFSVFISATLMSIIVSHPSMFSTSPWSIAVRISLIFFSLFICTTFPVLIITVLTNTYLKKQNESFERELEAQAEHYVALAESNKELRRFKHDFKNLRIGITKALTSGDCEMAIEMMETVQNDFVQATDNIVKYNTGNGIVDAILSEKQKKATASNTLITFNGIIPQTGFSPTDLCVIFGNTLDNAIEACENISGSENKIISVSVTCTNGFIFISITNPVSEKIVIHNNHIETTKKDRTSHGFGLYSLQKVAKKYGGEMCITSEDHTFILTLEFCL